MGKFNIYDDAEVVDVLDYASGTADRNGATIDTQGFEGVAFIVKFATIASSAVTSIKAQSGDASNMSDAADLEGTAQSIADDDDNQVFVIDVKRPKERYVRLVVDKDGTNACAESAVAILYGAQTKPTTKDSDVNGESFVSPAEGTA